MNEQTYEQMSPATKAAIDKIAPIEIDEKVPTGKVALKVDTSVLRHFSARNERRLIAKMQAAVAEIERPLSEETQSPLAGESR